MKAIMKLVEFCVRPYEIDRIYKGLLKQGITNFFIEEIKNYLLNKDDILFLPRFRVFFPLQLDKNKDLITEVKLILKRENISLYKDDPKIYISNILQEITIEHSEKT